MTKEANLRMLLKKLEEVETALGMSKETNQDTFTAKLHALTSDFCNLRAEEPLNENELKSVSALLAYTAHTQHADEKTVRAIVETKFGVKDVTALPQKNYDEVIRFLVDLQLDLIVN